MLPPTLVSATDFVIIGGSEPQKRLVSCIAEASTGWFLRPLIPRKPMTFVILEHHKFLKTRAAFHAYRTRLAFSNLAIRRIYLSSRVLADRDKALWVIGHELGHFVIRDGIEGQR
jgi:Zn-dependent protease with chaperone function